LKSAASAAAVVAAYEAAGRVETVAALTLHRPSLVDTLPPQSASGIKELGASLLDALRAGRV